jgi:hypothetical protein
MQMIYLFLIFVFYSFRLSSDSTINEANIAINNSECVDCFEEPIDISPSSSLGITIVESDIHNIIRKPFVINWNINRFVSPCIDNLGEEILIARPGTYYIMYYVVPTSTFKIKTYVFLDGNQVHSSKGFFKAKSFNTKSVIVTVTEYNSVLRIRIVGSGISGYVKAFLLINRLN